MSSISIEKMIHVELKSIPKDKLQEIYDLIHYFRIGIGKEKIEDVKSLRLASEKSLPMYGKRKKTMSGKVTSRLLFVQPKQASIPINEQ